MRQAIDDYLISVLARCRAPTTAQKYKGVLEMLLAFLAGHRVTLLSKMTPALFDKYVAERTSTQKLSTVQGEGVIIKTMFKWAKSRRLIGENPVADVKLDRPIFEAKPSPSLDQVNAILSIAKEPVRSQIAILAFTIRSTSKTRP